VLAFLAATASTLLAFYLTFVGAYSVLTPLSLLIYVLLWSLSALVDALLSDRY
jgi:Na+-transporting methylmalonyl-CoA/oxaloacetate decarboxylase gamma subunit